MTIRELARILNTSIEIIYPDSDGRWVAGLHAVEERKGGMLGGICGRGSDPQSALEALCLDLSGKPLVVRAMGTDRHEFKCPEDLRP